MEIVRYLNKQKEELINILEVERGTGRYRKRVVGRGWEDTKDGREKTGYIEGSMEGGME